MAFIDYYKILGVSKDIKQEDVRAAYKRRAKQFHPDLHPGDAKAKAKFQALNEAYDVIGDPEKRKKYDQYGEHWREAEAAQGGFGQGSAGGGSPFEGFDFSSFARGGSGFSSFFEELFGRGASSSRSRSSCSGSSCGGSSCGHSAPANGSDVEATVNIDLRTALLGGEVLIQLGDAGTKLRLKVKPGTQPGAKVRVRGKGRTGIDGRQGDLIITYSVKLPTNLTERQKEAVRECF